MIFLVFVCFHTVLWIQGHFPPPFGFFALLALELGLLVALVKNYFTGQRFYWRSFWGPALFCVLAAYPTWLLFTRWALSYEYEQFFHEQLPPGLHIHAGLWSGWLGTSWAELEIEASGPEELQRLVSKFRTETNEHLKHFQQTYPYGEHSPAGLEFLSRPGLESYRRTMKGECRTGDEDLFVDREHLRAYFFHYKP